MYLAMVFSLEAKLKSTVIASPWMNDEILSIKTKRTEGKWKSSKLKLHYLLLTDFAAVK